MSKDCSRKIPGTESNWASLPKGLIQQVLKRVGLADYRSASGVCPSWRQAALEDPLITQLPLLLLPYNLDSEERAFYSLIEHKKYEFKLKKVRGGRCCGSTAGWLILAYEDGRASLVNPFSGAQIQLPSQKTLALPARFRLTFERLKRSPGPGFFDRAVLSVVPSAGDCVVAGFLDYERIVVCRPEGERWTFVEEDQPTKKEYCDLICFKGWFYALDIEGGLTVFDMGPNPKARRWDMGPSYLRSKSTGSIHLVESAGELLMVERSVLFCLHHLIYEVPEDLEIIYCNIYKLDSHGRRWVKVIGDPRWDGSDPQQVQTRDQSLSQFCLRVPPPAVGDFGLSMVKRIVDHPTEGDGSFGHRLLFMGNCNSWSLSDDGFPELSKKSLRNDYLKIFWQAFSTNVTMLFPGESKWSNQPCSHQSKCPPIWVTPNLW